MRLTDQLTRIIFFTGKGGVGKTSLASATAVRLADAGHQVLLVSTDPASNLDEVLAFKPGPAPQPISTVPGLQALNLDPREAAEEYRRRMVEPWRGVLPDSVLQSMEEQFSGACTVEIAAFEKFAALVANPAATAGFDFVVFDTAPTGHTLRLLALPAAWTDFLAHNTTGISCAGPLAGLKQQQQIFQQSADLLRDPRACTCVLVSRPEHSALLEAARTSRELHAAGILNQRLIINGFFTARNIADPIAAAFESRMRHALHQLPQPLRSLPCCCFPLEAVKQPDVAWLRSLREIECPSVDAPSETAAVPPATNSIIELSASFQHLISELASSEHGVILTMGKGGVGKTSVARAIALALAHRGSEVLLTTTDPAAHAFHSPLPNLHVSAIDPQLETARYRQHVLDQHSQGLDEAGLALLEEDLRSPCTEEIAVFRAFADVVHQGARQFVVIDTAPTGHTILLLDAAQAFHREVQRQGRNLPESVLSLLPRLRDPQSTRVIIVTLPEATPVHEAAQLQNDLRRAGIEPFAWVVNQVFSELSVTDPGLVARQHAEQTWLGEVRQLAARTVLVPWSPHGFPESAAILQSKAQHERPGFMNTTCITPALENFLQAREAEFSQIPVERVAALRQVADYIRSCHQQHRNASLVFICTHNSRRSHFSQIWAQVAAHRYGLREVETFSGGTEVTAMNSRVADSLRRSGLSVEIQSESAANSNPHYLVHHATNTPPLVCFSKIHNAPPNPTANFCAVMTCAHADEACPLVPSCDLRAAIRYEDPKVSDNTPDEASVYDLRSAQICRDMLLLMKLAQDEARPK
jgi:arsenite-transporting ATPase